MKAKRPEKNTVIGVFSSSSPISATVPSRYERGKRYLKEKGFEIIDGSCFGKKDFYRSGTIKERAKEFNELLYREDVEILMASIGGGNTNSILPYIDYDYLKKHPKVIVGFSDVTALLLAVYEKTGLVTFYGPSLAASFGEFPPFVDRTYEEFGRIVFGEGNIPYEYRMPEVWTEEFVNWSTQDCGKKAVSNEWLCIHPGKARGRLIGGNVNTISGIFGTDYMPKIKKGDILLLEDTCKTAMQTEKLFSMLKLSGAFEKAGGILLGKHERFEDNGTGRKPYEILLEVLGETKLPILAEFDCCHTHPMFTLPIGCEILMDAENKTVTLLESPFQ